MAEEPMNRQASIGTPAFAAMRAIGSTSRTMVRAAQLGRIFSRPRAISRQSAIACLGYCSTWAH